MHVTLFLNHQCNLNCRYCYNGRKWHQPMPMDILEKGIDLAFSTGDAQISFFGGEPLLEFDRMVEAVRLARIREAATRTPLLRFSVTVNGTLLDEKTLSFFRDENFFVAVSLDGGRAAQDAGRRMADGQSSYARVVQSISLMKKYLREVVVASVVDPVNVHRMADSFAHILSLGASRLSFAPNFDALWSEADLAVFADQMEQIVELYVDAFRQGAELHFSPFTGKIRARLSGGLQRRCPFGDGEVTVSPSGRLYPCERLVGDDTDDALCIGHVAQGIDLHKVMAFQRRLRRKNEDCATCAIENRCGWFCGCAQMSTTGTLGSVSRLLCEVEQIQIRCADRAAAILFREQNPSFMHFFYGVEVTESTGQQRRSLTGYAPSE